MSTDLRVLKTKEALHHALLALLNEKSLHTITITELCKSARVNRGTFYFHYGQIEDIFEEYLNIMMDDLSASYLEPYKHAPTLTPDILDPTAIRIFHHVKKYNSFYRIVFSKQVPLSYYYLLFEHLKELLRKDLERYNTTSVSTDMLSAYQSNAILGMILEWKQEDFRQSVVEMNQMLTDILRLNRRD